MIKIKYLKSVSPLIATILLIVIAVILVVAVLTWGKDFVGESLEETKIFYQESNLTGLVVVQDIINKHVVILNNSQEDINVIGFRLIVPHDNQFYNVLYHNDFVLDNVYIPSRNTKTIYLHCFPDRSFGLDLLLDNNSFVRVNVIVRNYTSELCSIYKSPVDGLVFREDFSSEKNISLQRGFISPNRNITIENGVCINDTGYINQYIGGNTGNGFSTRFRLNSVTFPTVEHAYFFAISQLLFRINYDQGSGNIITAGSSTRYVNGLQTNEIPLEYDGYIDVVITSTSNNILNNHFYIFSYFNGHSLSALKAEIDFYEFYNRVLTPEEVLLLYNTE